MPDNELKKHKKINPMDRFDFYDYAYFIIPLPGVQDGKLERNIEFIPESSLRVPFTFLRYFHRRIDITCDSMESITNSRESNFIDKCFFGLIMSDT